MYSFAKKQISVVFFVILIFIPFSGCLDQNAIVGNIKPIVSIHSPSTMNTVLGIVNISGVAFDPDSNDQIEYVEINIDNTSDWDKAEGTTNWTYQWKTYSYSNGLKHILVRAWDGSQYSKQKIIQLRLANPQDIHYNTHRWAVFIAAANFPESDMNKLGNGGLYLAQNMSDFFVEQYRYSTSNVNILFDDGWLRNDSGFGEPIKKLNKIPRTYNITYGAATKNNVISTLNEIITEANRFEDSEVFIWIFNHGFGDYNRKLTGGKVLERSAIFLWDDYLIDEELGMILDPLDSQETGILIDACYIGGFADKTIYNLPTLPGLRSGVPRPGRVVITSTSKFRTGIAIIEYGPLFSLLWFDGLQTQEADGFRPGLLNRGRLPFIRFEDGSVSIEESFYYARYLLRNVENINEFNTMQPQINDQYPNRGLFRNLEGLVLGD